MESPAIRSYKCSPILGSPRYCIYTTPIGASSLQSVPTVTESHSSIRGKNQEITENVFWVQKFPL